MHSLSGDVSADINPPFELFLMFIEIDNNGERIGWTKLGDNMEQKYGAPYYHIHVSDHFEQMFPYLMTFGTRGPIFTPCCLKLPHLL
jgi:hypothetical protein